MTGRCQRWKKNPNVPPAVDGSGWGSRFQLLLLLFIHKKKPKDICNSYYISIIRTRSKAINLSNMSDDTKTIIDYFVANAEKLGDKTFMTQPMGGGDDNVVTFSYAEVLAGAKKVAGYIESLGYPPKSKIAICSKNCAWWVIADLGIWLAGHISVPVSGEF
jgi:hypothetical protein